VFLLRSLIYFFSDGQSPSGISESASNNAADNNDNSASIAARDLGVSALLAIGSLFAML